MGKPRAPKPPDPRETSAASTGTSVATALANTQLGNVNQVGPNGSLTYDQTGSTDFTDPYTGQSYKIPTFTATTELTDQGQRIFDANQSAQLGLARTADRAGKSLQSIIGQKINAGRLPARGRVPMGTYGRNRDRVEQAIMDRMQPSIDADRDRMETSLANKGIAVGSDAYSDSQADFGRNVNDARLGAILAGGQEQSRLFGLDMARFDAQNDLRGQALNERFALRNQPINEITALLSGSQVQQPNFRMNTPSRIPTTDNAGLINANYNQRFGNYQQQLGSWNSGIGGLFGMGAAAVGAL